MHPEVNRTCSWGAVPGCGHARRRAEPGLGVAIHFALMGVSFIGWFRRQDELVRLGRPVEMLKARHYAVMLLGFAVSMAVVLPLK